MEKDIGRGKIATIDMKVRIAALRREGRDVVETLWQRNLKATVGGEGYEYEFADGGTDGSRH